MKTTIIYTHVLNRGAKMYGVQPMRLIQEGGVCFAAITKLCRSV